MELLLYIPSLPWSTGQRNSFCTLPHCLGVVGTGTSPIHYIIALVHWAVELLLYIASLPWGMASGTPFLHCRTAKEE